MVKSSCSCGNLKEYRSKVCLKCWKILREQKVQNKRREDVLSGKASFRRIRAYLIDTKGCCSICGISEWNGKELPLILDHIDGNASNNDLKNLRLVCSNCDSQLPTYKSKNKNSARRNRLK